MTTRYSRAGKDRQVDNCRIVAFRSAKAAFFRGAKGDTCFRAGPKPLYYPVKLLK